MTPCLISQTNKSLSDYTNVTTNKTINYSVQKGRFQPYSGWGRGGKKASLTSVSPVSSTNGGIRPENFLILSFNPFDRLV